MSGATDAKKLSFLPPSLVLEMYECICGESFSRQKSLGLHRNSCKDVLAEENALFTPLARRQHTRRASQNVRATSEVINQDVGDVSEPVSLLLCYTTISNTCVVIEYSGIFPKPT